MPKEVAGDASSSSIAKLTGVKRLDFLNKPGGTSLQAASDTSDSHVWTFTTRGDVKAECIHDGTVDGNP